MILLFLACVHQPGPATPSAPSPQASERGAAEFGGDRWGFVEHVSGSGRMVVLGRLPGEGGGAGPEPTNFGHHGEVAFGAASVVIDTVSGEEREVEALVSASADGRWLVVLDEGRAWLVDETSGGWSPLDEGGPAVDLSQDQNRCLPPRTAAFARVAYVSQGAVVVRDLPDGAPMTYPTDTPIWRVWPRVEGDGVSAFQVSAPEDGQSFPVQRTSCACLACQRFSMSYGFYGWSGPDFTGVALTREGAHPAVALPVPYGERAWIIDGALVDQGGAPTPTPEGCSIFSSWPGAPALKLDCGDEAALWLPGGQPLKLGFPAQVLERLGTVDTGGAPSLIVPSLEPGAPSRLIHLDTLQVVNGPPVDRVGPGGADGVVLASQGGSVLAWDTGSGETHAVPLPEGREVSELGEHIVYLSGGGAVLMHGAQTLVLPRVASVPIAADCVLGLRGAGSPQPLTGR